MALVKCNKLERLEKTRNTLHKEVYGTYTIFTEKDDKYFQIDTYGSPYRKMPEKISQSIQFDRDSATFLVDLLIKEFNIK